MPEPTSLTDHAWKDAEALVQRVEEAARHPSIRFFPDLVHGLQLTAKANRVRVRCWDGGELNELSRVGVFLHDDEEHLPPSTDDQAAHSHWIVEQNNERLLCTQQILGDLRMELDIRFDQPAPLATRQSLAELSEVVLELASGVFLRSHAGELRTRIDAQDKRDVFLAQLAGGIGLADSFAAIANAVAAFISVDRVCLLRWKPTGCRLIAASTQSQIDRRARQVRLLERLTQEYVNSGVHTGEMFGFSVGTANSTIAFETLPAYLQESGSRELQIVRIGSFDCPLAVIVMEIFRGQSGNENSIENQFASIRQPVQVAIENAISRDDAGWGLIAGKLAGQSSRRRILGAVGGLSVLVVAAMLVPADLKIPVDGRVTAAKRSHLYASAEGVVENVLVDNGDAVVAGDPLITLRSHSLDLQQRNIEAALATSRTKLDGLFTLRSSAAKSPTVREASSSAEENVLKTEIAGFEKQLELIAAQQAALLIRSPHDGVVDRWNLKEALTSRPVAHGQYLLDVTAESAGWILELEVPDKNVNYLLDQQNREPCEVTFRLRSDPARVHHAVISEIADVAHVHLNARSGQYRSGASVMAEVHCGRRSIGFVWARGVIEWCRSRAWF
jgi:Barrel-sandwich domain of CusB or HlyD membrane-fusion